MALLAAIHVSLTRYDEAEVLLQNVLAFQHENHGRHHRDMLDIMSNLAHVLEELERYDEAEEMLTRLIELQREVLGNNHRDTRRTITALQDLRIFVRDSEEFFYDLRQFHIFKSWPTLLLHRIESCGLRPACCCLTND